jgi:succinate dehydrogenase/fumarate reductase cytochrome b subunit
MLDLFLPNVAYASESIDQFILNLNKFIINPLILLLFALAVAYFVYGVFEFLMNQENDEKKTTGKKHMLWGIVGITIMMGVFAILHLILNTLNIQGINPEEGTVTLPQ